MKKKNKKKINHIRIKSAILNKLAIQTYIFRLNNLHLKNTNFQNLG